MNLAPPMPRRAGRAAERGDSRPATPATVNRTPVKSRAGAVRASDTRRTT